MVLRCRHTFSKRASCIMEDCYTNVFKKFVKNLAINEAQFFFMCAENSVISIHISTLCKIPTNWGEVHFTLTFFPVVYSSHAMLHNIARASWVFFVVVGHQYLHSGFMLVSCSFSKKIYFQFKLQISSNIKMCEK